MHPSEYKPNQPLSDWKECRLELHCCQEPVLASIDLLIERYGDQTFGELFARLRCQKCGARHAPVYLSAPGHRSHTGAVMRWRIELVPASEEKPRVR